MKEKRCHIPARIRRCTAFVFTWVELPKIGRTLFFDLQAGRCVGLINLGFGLNLRFGEGTIIIYLPFLILSVGYDPTWDRLGNLE